MKGIILGIAIGIAPSLGIAADIREDLPGVYTAPRMFCDEGKPGEAGGPVLFEADAISLAGMRCSLAGWSFVSRMDAVLVDATCSAAPLPVRTRLFVNRSDDGLVIVSRELGSFTLERCPEAKK